MPLRLYWLLLMNLAGNINADHVYSYGSQYRGEPGNLAEAENTPATRGPLPQEVSCSDIKGQGPCFEMLSTGGSNEPLFQPASYNAMSSSSGVTSQGSRHGDLQLEDNHVLPGFASSFNSIFSDSGSNLVQNLQPIGSSKYFKDDQSNPHIVPYGPVYRLLKPQGAHSSTRTMPSANYNLPISRSVTTTSKSIPNVYKAGFSQISYDATQQVNAYNSVPATYSRRKPSLNNMIISSGPMITFIKPNQSNHQPVPAINQAPSNYETHAHIKPLVTVDQPPAETSKPFEHSQGINYQRLTSQPSMNQQSRTTDSKFIQLGNSYSSSDTTYKPSIFFKPAQTIYLQRTSNPLQSSQQLAENDLYESRPIAFPLNSFVYKFTRPGYNYGTSISTGTSGHVPSSSSKTRESNYNQTFSQARLSFPMAVYGSSFPAVVSDDSTYSFTQLGKVYGSSDAYTSDSQPTVSSSSLSQNPYFKARQGRGSYSMFRSLQPIYKYFPTRTCQMPTKSFNTSFSQNDSVQNSEQLKPVSDVQAGNLKGFQTVSFSAPVQNFYQGKCSQNPNSQLLESIQSHPYEPKNLFHYLSSLPFPAGQPVSSNYN